MDLTTLAVFHNNKIMQLEYEKDKLTERIDLLEEFIKNLHGLK